MDIFKENKLYPNEDAPIVEHYSGYFDNVFVGLIPFFKVPNHSIKEDYPDDAKITESGIEVTWNQIIENTEIKNFKELNKALMTSIGAFKKAFERQDLLKKLNNYTESQNIWDPTEGTFDVFIKKKIYSICKSCNLLSLIVKDEFYEKTKTLNLNVTTCNEFIEKIGFKDYHIYTADKELLFTIDWDFYFFFVAYKGNAIDKSIIEKSFEGFVANKTDTHSWTWENGEVDSILNSSKTETVKTNWWNKLIK
jgi:hypothetical protein